MTVAKDVRAICTTANLTLTSLTFEPSYVQGRRLSAGTLTLSAPAPPGEVTVALSSDHPDVADPPSFVFDQMIIPMRQDTSPLTLANAEQLNRSRVHAL